MKRDTLVTIAIFAASLIVSIVVVRQWRPASTPSPLPIHTFAIGDHAPQIRPRVYTGATRTLLLYVRSSCGYCTDSMPFYQSLSRQRRPGQNIRLVAIGRESEDVTRDYLDRHHVVVDEVVAAGTIVATPTLVLVDSSGVVQHVWVGLLSTPGEQEVAAMWLAGS